MKTILLLLLLVSFSIGAQTFTDSNLPIIVLTSEGGQAIVDDPRIVCHMGIINNGPDIRNNLTDPYNNYDGRIEIEIRGSTSQQYPKKGYGLETQDSLGNNLQVSVLGMSPENDWILYGPYPDKTMIRNAFTYELARKMGRYASDYRYCELIINGEYRGVYMMLERIKRDANRVNIDDIHTPNLWNDTLTGGYIVKVDKLTGESGYTWTSNYNNKVVFQFHDPEFDEINNLQASYMENFIGDFEDAVNSTQFDDPILGYAQYIDRESFYDFFIFQELGRTVDGYRSSSFLHKDKDGFSWNSKLVAGPMWDFNLSYGNADYCNAELTTGWQYNFDDVCDFTTAIPFWWKKLLQSPSYSNGLKCRWEELRTGPLHTDNVNLFIDSMANYLEEGRIRNFQKWPIIGQYVNWNGFVGQTYEQNLSFLKTYIENRSIWIDNNLGGTCSLSIDEPVFISETHQIWPNPANDVLNIGISLFKTSTIDFKILDLSGKEIYKDNLGVHSSGTHAFQINNLDIASGVYMYFITTDGNVAHSGKVVVQ